MFAFLGALAAAHPGVCAVQIIDAMSPGSPSFYEASYLMFNSGGVGSRLEVEIRIRRPGATELHIERTRIGANDGGAITSLTSRDGGPETVTTYHFEGPGERILPCGNGYENVSFDTLPPQELRVGSRQVRCSVVRRRVRNPAYYASDPVRARISESRFWKLHATDDLDEAIQTVDYSPEVVYRDGRRVPGHVIGRGRVSDLDGSIRVGGTLYRCRVERSEELEVGGRVRRATTCWTSDALPITFLRVEEVEVDSTGAKTTRDMRLRSFDLVP